MIDSMSEEDADAAAADEGMPTTPVASDENVRRRHNLEGDVRVGFQCGNFYDTHDYIHNLYYIIYTVHDCRR